ncbi:MAG: hypothetical protein ACFCUV_12265 [Rivularia sp. (in: cyanobacteria)]
MGGQGDGETRGWGDKGMGGWGEINKNCQLTPNSGGTNSPPLTFNL